MLVNVIEKTEHDTIKGEDRLGNPVVIPGDFKFAGEADDTVEDGIIIEDKDGNQFVWIPVSNIDGNNDGSGTGLIKTTDKGDVEITLGRYIFDGSGTPTLKQSGANCSERSDATKIFEDNVNYYEDTHEPNRENGGEGAKSLEDFIASVETNHGYYLARYEAGSGTDNKPVSKVGEVWNNITQLNASAAAQRMYGENENFVSDLVNSYAWDTAIVYIQTMGNENYANEGTTETNDVKCNIYNMVGNVLEWTTEYSEVTTLGGRGPCVYRGGYTANRGNEPDTCESIYYRVPSTFILKKLDDLNAKNLLANKNQSKLMHTDKKINA